MKSSKLIIDYIYNPIFFILFITLLNFKKGEKSRCILAFISLTTFCRIWPCCLLGCNGTLWNLIKFSVLFKVWDKNTFSLSIKFFYGAKTNVARYQKILPLNSSSFKPVNVDREKFVLNSLYDLAKLSISCFKWSAVRTDQIF